MKYDELLLERIGKLSVADYSAAFAAIREQLSETDLLMLKAHYQSPDNYISAHELAGKVGYANFNAANLRYGLLAGRLLEYFQIHFEKYVNVNVLVDDFSDNLHWRMRKNVHQALRELGWFGMN